MPYRIHIAQSLAGLLLAFEGLLDEAALADLRERLAHAPGTARLHLRAGTEVVPTCLEPLRALPVAITAESPFMARLLADRQP